MGFVGAFPTGELLLTDTSFFSSLCCLVGSCVVDVLALLFLCFCCLSFSFSFFFLCDGVLRSFSLLASPFFFVCEVFVSPFFPSRATSG